MEKITKSRTSRVYGSIALTLSSMKIEAPKQEHEISMSHQILQLSDDNNNNIEYSL